jgi:hypothetical protein
VTRHRHALPGDGSGPMEAAPHGWDPEVWSNTRATDAVKCLVEGPGDASDAPGHGPYLPRRFRA